VELIEFIVGLVVELLLEVLGEAVLEVGLAGLKEALGRENRSPQFAAVGYFILGASLGGVSLLLCPGRLLWQPPVPGLSLFAAPLAGGGAMLAWGRFRRRRGHDTTNLASFPGGAAFALGYALVRFVWIG
jgi:hypothetical protein